MENDKKDSKACHDQIEKIMQELDATNTGSNSSTPPALDEPHRPILLPPEIKEEPKEKDAEMISQQEDVCSNNELVAVPTHISDDPKSLSNTQGQSTQHVMQIKKGRVEDSNEVSAEPPKIDKDITSSETQNTIQTPVAEGIIGIKPEPIDAPSLAADAASENVTYNRGVEVPTETNMDDSTAPNSPNGVPEADGALPDNFFDDLIKDADNITAAALECSEPNTLENESTEMLVNIKNELVDTTTIPETTTTETLESTEPPQQQKHTAEQNIATPELLNVKSEPVGTTAVSETTTSAPIPENFFDDLLVDHVAKRIDDVVNHGLEIKYSERLKELELLEAEEQSSNKAHKKHKKKKKKSHKRTHSEANEDEETLVANVNKRSKHTSHSPSMPQAACIRVKSEFTTGEESTLHGGTPFSNHLRPDTFNLDSVEPETSAAGARCMIRVKSEFVTNLPVAEESNDCLPVRETELFLRRSNVNRNGLIMDMTAPLGFKRIKLESDSEESEAEESILPKDKMENSKQRAILAIEEFNKANKNRKDPSFIYTTTVRKLPNSSSYIRQQIYDNRSPLHNVNNVLYKFNSYANHFNLQEWGIEALPPKASEVAKILGFDIHALDKKKKTFTFPPEIQKIKREAIEQTEKRLIDVQTSFLRSESTQTDKVTGHDIAIQTIPQGNNIGTQTTAMSAAGSSKYGDLPLVRQISTFNENQLMALSDFADLIREPALAADSTELYRLHHRLIDIYKYSQLPSEFGQNTQHSNKYSMHDPRQKRINSLAESPQPPAPRMLVRHEAQPQSWPHTVVRPHAVVQPPYHRPLAPLRPQTPVPIRQRLERTADMSYTIPVIANVTSIHQSGTLPMDPRQNTFGGGAMRR
ncbi:PREDICTED: protein panoramix [Bactrocera latifrons]|uniref:protein panoramix n=1 Tax=Bactrocera latifrons TaxID=174628 RepID=UPI0008DDAA7A|nr:PREDICTED: protein panoramix [Bactrocera latifrons]